MNKGILVIFFSATISSFTLFGMEEESTPLISRLGRFVTEFFYDLYDQVSETMPSMPSREYRRDVTQEAIELFPHIGYFVGEPEQPISTEVQQESATTPVVLPITKSYQSIQTIYGLETALLNETERPEADEIKNLINDFMEQSSKKTRRKMALKLLTQHTVREPGFYNTHVDAVSAETLRELNVLVGPQPDNQQASLIESINQTETEAGFMTLSHHLANEHPIEYIRGHQEAISLIMNMNDKDEIINQLRNIKEEEGAFLSFWLTTEPGCHYADRFSAILAYQKWNIDMLDHSAFVCELQAIGNMINLVASPIGALSSMKAGFATASASPKTAEGIASTGSILASAQNLSKSKDIPLIFKLMTFENFFMQKKLMAVRRLIGNFRAIAALLENKDARFDLLVTMLRMPKDDADFTKLIELLETDTFKDEASFWSNIGNIHVAYRLMEKCRDKFLAAYAALGRVDFLVSLARLITHSEQRYCLASFIEDSESPVLDAVDAWCPLLLHQNMEARRIVLNSMTIGTKRHMSGAQGEDSSEEKEKEMEEEPQSNHSPKALIITGPNRRGKTTDLRVAGIGALMSLRLGIAPARSFSLTPLSILTSINIADNIQRGESHFEAEAVRAGHIRRAIAGNRDYLFLILLDEPFTGTGERLAQHMAYEYLLRLGTANNTLVLATSHLPRVIELESNYPNLFANYFVTENHMLQRGTDYTQEDYNSSALNILRNHLGNNITDAIAQRLGYETNTELIMAFNQQTE